MQINTFTVLFFVLKTRLLRNGEAPVYVRITVNGSRCDMGISRSINPDIWDPGKGKAKGNTRAVKEFNEYLDEYRSRILQAKKSLESDFRPVTPESIKRKLLGIDDQNYYFLVVFKDHNEKLKFPKKGVLFLVGALLQKRDSLSAAISRAFTALYFMANLLSSRAATR